ncbi:AIPR family protein [Ferruginibacter sp.]
MATLDDRINELYNQFIDFPPKNKIVRLGISDDAFTLVAFEILFQNFHSVKKLNYNEGAHRELLCQYIVPPPDDSIDIFFEEKDLDECKYHIVQVKNSILSPGEIEQCFILMENSIKIFLNKPRDSKKNLKEIISGTDFSKQYKSDCVYYVVHRGQTNYIRSQKSNQKIITGDELQILENGTRQMSVPIEDFEIDTGNNFIVNNFIDNSESKKVNTHIPQSLLCNFSGYDLAKLNNKYANTLLGRNILYGQNLRESLNKNSKTYDSMFETVSKEPDLFLFYNNGITIISSAFNAVGANGKEKITVENFSIINGAQTTSTLGAYLRDAEINNEQENIENLKKVFVLTKIYQINKDLKNHENISENIKIFNNTQTPLSSRDMVSIRKEQIDLQERLFQGESPNIFVFIKKGETIPGHPKTQSHQRVTNEVLAQLTLCGFCSEPFTAKDKKTKIFDNDGKDDVILNSVYDRLFNQKSGLLFNRSKREIDELLFIYRLHEDTKKFQKIYLKNLLQNLNQKALANPVQVEQKENQMNSIKRNIEIANVCLFYNISCYFEMRSNFDNLIPNIENLSFETRKYFDNSETYKDKLIKSFSELVYSKTIDIIRNNSGVENVNNWIRAEKGQEVFLSTLRNSLINEGFTISEKYIEFVKLFKA